MLAAGCAASCAGNSNADGGADSGATDAGVDAGTGDGGAPDGGAPDGGPGDAGPADAGPWDAGLAVSRPFGLVIPSAYDGGTELPLVVLLHGYSATAASQDFYFRLSALAEKRTFLLALPDGKTDQLGNRFWDATDACCNGTGMPVDDVAYLTDVVRDVRHRYLVDARRIYLVGHSNGAFMAHRLACDRADLFAGIVSLAGAVWKDETRCAPTGQPAILQVHGTVDAVILYGGGKTSVNAPEYPGAIETVDTWAQKYGCTGGRVDAGAPLDLDSVLPGAETTRERYAGCPGGEVQLWTINGGTHLPALNSSWAGTIYDFLDAHPKP